MSIAEAVALGILGVVTLVWVANFVLSVLPFGYVSNPEIHLAFMAAIGFFSTARGLMKKAENSK